MARRIGLNTVRFYRALIEVNNDGRGWKESEVYGPYSSRSACVDRDARRYRYAYEEGRRRVTRQVQDVFFDEKDGTYGIQWIDVDEGEK